MPRIDLIQVRRGTAAEWTSANPTLEVGEYGFETDTRQSKIGNGTDDWNTLGYLSATASSTLQQVTDNGATTDQEIEVAGLTVNGDGIGIVPSGDAGSTFIGFQSTDGSEVEHTLPDVSGYLNVCGYDWNASTNTPALANTDTDKENVDYVVSVAGSVDFGAGSISFGVGDIVSNNGTNWFKKVDNNQSGNSSASDEGAFSGVIDLTNKDGTYYDEYDLGVSGQITFSIASSPEIFAYSYLVIDSDGATEFATKPNLDSVFNEQYNIPNDRILTEGKHSLYILKTPTGAALSIPTNLYNPDVTAPTVTSATIEDATPDELVVVFSEEVNVTNTTGLTLDNDFSALTIDSIVSGNGTDTVTFQLSGSASNGETGDFVYSGSNTIEDLSGNALAAGSTAVTNNIAGALAYTLFNLTEASNVYTKNAGTATYAETYATSTTAFTGAFDYEVEIENADSKGTMIALSSNGTNRAFNDATPWIAGIYITSADTVRKIQNGSIADAAVTESVSYNPGDTLRLSRDGSDVVTAYVNGVLVNTFPTLSGNVYLHFATNVLNNKIYNPTFTQN